MVPTIPETEILVHITAPSRASDDVVYRQLAQAYLDFKPRHRQALPPSISDENRSLSQEYATPAPLPPLVDSQDLSFRSAVDNRGSPPLDTTVLGHDFGLRLDTTREVDVADQASWHAPPSEIADSYPVPDRDLIRSSPTKALERLLGRPASRLVQQEDNADPLHSLLPRVDRSVEVPSSHASREGAVPAVQAPDSSPDVVPSSPYMAPSGAQSSHGDQSHCQEPGISIGSEKTRGHASDLMVVDVTERLQESQGIAHASHISGSSFEPDTGPAVEAHNDRARTTIEVSAGRRESSDATTSLMQEQFGNEQGHRDETQHDDGDELEILPLSPAVSLDDLDPDDLIPAQLVKLAGDLSTRYRPIQKREIEPLSRGHWLLDCSSWTSDHHNKTWAFLARYIRSGLAGWGVWCRRDQAHQSIKLYCWGHLVKHTYLLLYLASERKLKTTGACWIGPSGELALEIQPQGARAETQDEVV